MFRHPLKQSATMPDICIVGGGLAGLSLGIGLRKRGVSVSILEAYQLPRHKVCGEFMAGIDVTTLQRLGIAGHFHDVLHHRTTSWFRHGREVRRDQLPSPAYGISRYTLDARLADSFRALGGELTLGQRAKLKQSEPGLIWAAGRRRAQGGWLGIKCHCRGFPLQADLEVHLGSLGYAGASAVEDGWINVCGLFRVRSDLKCRKEDALLRYAEASGMESLADRLRSAPKREGSFTATAGMTFSRLWQLPDTPVIGDALSVIPPFTGNGMTMAFESAFLALNPLVKYAAGKRSWTACVEEINRLLRAHFRSRLAIARILHPWIYTSSGQGLLSFMTRLRVLPFQTFFRMLH